VTRTTPKGSEILIRLARKEDAEALRRIYEPYCLDSIITFEEEAPSLAEMEERILSVTSFLPWLVAEDRDNTILGYAYAGKHRLRRGYQWSVETSVYLRQGESGRGVGKKLYGTLFKILKAQGLINAYAGIALPNENSVGFHDALGFKQFCNYEKVGFKNGQWVDVAWWHRLINPVPEGIPDAPLAISQVNIDTIIGTISTKS